MISKRKAFLAQEVGKSLVQMKVKLVRKLTKFSNHATSSSLETTIAVQPASVSSDLKEDNLDETSLPAYLMGCNLIGSEGGFGRDSFQTSSTRLKSYR